MCKIAIKLNSFDKVKNFVNIIKEYEDDFDLVSDNHYVIDAKSIMGIFSLDLTKTLTLVSTTANQGEMEIALMGFK